MQLHGESVEVTNVQRPEVGVEGIVQEGLVDGELDRGVNFGACSYGAWLRLCGPLAGRSILTRVRERGAGIRRMRVGGKVEPI